MVVCRLGTSFIAFFWTLFWSGEVKQVLWEATSQEPISGGFDCSWQASGKSVKVKSPIDGAEIGEVVTATVKDSDRIVSAAHKAFNAWRLAALPFPVRGLGTG